MIRALPVLLAMSLACSAPPGAPVGDAGPSGSFSWRTALAELDEAVLAACGGNGEFYAVGGSQGRGLFLEWTGSEWYAPWLPDGTSTLWWCWVDDGGGIWAVGERGTVLRRRDGRWQLEDTLAAVDDEVTLYGVWGSAADDVYVVGGSFTNPNVPSAIGHFDGELWVPFDIRALTGEPLFKVWGTAASDIWAVGAGGVALHFDGVQWTGVATPTDARLIAISGSSSSDVYAVGGTSTGVVLRWDGNAWSEFARAPEPLSGVWTAPGEPLYVGGNRGFAVRYDSGDNGRPSPNEGTLASLGNDLCIHAMYGSGNAVVAAGADLYSGGAGGWDGRILTHGGPGLEGPIDRQPRPDAGIEPDAGAFDAGAGGPGPGEPCGQPPDVCAPGLECWLLLDSGQYICTQLCSDASECTEYGADPCCVQPGFQTLDTVCIPGQFGECGA